MGEFVDPKYDEEENAKLSKAGANGKPHKNKEEGGSRKAFSPL